MTSTTKAYAPSQWAHKYPNAYDFHSSRKHTKGLNYNLDYNLADIMKWKKKLTAHFQICSFMPLKHMNPDTPAMQSDLGLSKRQPASCG
jgi:hypothetical protein